MALGAPARAIVGGLLVRGTLFVFIGIGAGVAGAIAGSRVMESMLYQVDPRDPVTLGAVAVIIGLVAIGSSLWPAWRSTRVDPVRVLRAE